MTQNNFFKREHLSLKVIYIIGLITFLIHFFDFSIGNQDYKILPVIAYSSMTIFFFRLALAQWREKSK